MPETRRNELAGRALKLPWGTKGRRDISDMVARGSFGCIAIVSVPIVSPSGATARGPGSLVPSDFGCPTLGCEDGFSVFPFRVGARPAVSVAVRDSSTNARQRTGFSRVPKTLSESNLQTLDSWGPRLGVLGFRNQLILLKKSVRFSGATRHRCAA
jgi:hypothetical protein